MPDLTFTGADSVITDLNDRTSYVLKSLRGSGVPPLIHETVKTPSRRGEIYIRAVLEPRFLVVVMGIFGSSPEDSETKRRALVRALNPKLGIGTLKWTPNSTVYAIDCVLEQGLRFEGHGPISPSLNLSFRCPDPTWYDPAVKSSAFAITGGLSIPMTIPMSISALTQLQVIDNIGDLDTFPTITIPGPFTNPKITNVTTSKVISFSGLTVLTGETFIIDMDKQTAKVDGVSVMDKRTSDSEAWALETGLNTVRFETSTGQATATVAWFTRFLGV